MLSIVAIAFISLISSITLQAQYLPASADLDTLTNVSRIDLTAKPAYSIAFSEPVSYNDTTLLMGTITSVARDSEGRVYLADIDQLMIHQFQADGSYIESFGRNGEGPGEFRSLVRIRYRDGKVYALDRNQNRITAFSTDSLNKFDSISLSVNPQSSGSHLRSMPEEFFVLPENKFLIAFSLVSGDSEKLYFQPVDIFEPEGGYLNSDEIKIPVDQSVLFSNSGNMGFIYPVYGRKSKLYVTSDGSIYTNWSENVLFKTYNLCGEYKSALYGDITKKTLTLRQLGERYSDFYMDILRNEELPDTWPAIRGFLVDDEKRLWIELFTDDLKVSEWLIISRQDGVLGTFTLSASDTIYLIKDNLIYFKSADRDGMETLKRVRVLFN